ncbi:MAG: DUF3829 domain-containing protein [Myxococcota bacterium]
MKVRGVAGILAFVVFAAFGVSSTTGCKTLKKYADKAKKSAEQKQEDKADNSQGQKLNKYLACINQVGGSARRAEHQYFRWLKDPKAGPTGSEKVVLGTLAITSGKQCRRDLEKAKELKPEMEKLEEAGEEFVEALDKLEPINEEVHAYYKKKEHTKDDFKKGKELHPKYYEALHSFFEKSKGLNDAFSDVKDELNERDLERFKRKKRMLAYHHLKFMMEARHVLHATDAEMIKDIDVKNLADKHDVAKEAFDDMDDYASSNGAKTKKVSGWSNFNKDARAYIDAVAAVRKKAEDGFKFSQAEIAQLNRGDSKRVKGHPDHMLDMFNKMIQSNNFMNWKI